jgi:hypothetical protein
MQKTKIQQGFDASNSSRMPIEIICGSLLKLTIECAGGKDIARTGECFFYLAI